MAEKVGKDPSGAYGDELIDRHIGLVRQLATDIRRRYRLSIELDELVAAGIEGLLQAANTYDQSTRTSFSGFAHYRIRGAIIDNCRRLGAMRRVYRRQLSFEAGANAILAEQAEILPRQRSVEADTNWIASTLDSLVTAHTLASDPETLLKHGPERQLVDKRRRARLREGMSTINERERSILVRHYLEYESLSDIASDMGFSRSWASRLHARALEKLRRHLLNPDQPASAASG